MSDNPTLTPKQVTESILELNNNAIQLILEDNISSALEIWKTIEIQYEIYKTIITDPKIKIIINHNISCCYQKMKDIPKCITYLEKVNKDFDEYLNKKHKIEITNQFFIDKILSEQNESKILLGDFILELRFCAKFHLQMCAAYSQNGNHTEAWTHAKLAAWICEDNIAKTYYLLKQTELEFKSSKNELYSNIFMEKVSENSLIIAEQYNIVTNCAIYFRSDKPINIRLTQKEIDNFINDPTFKISTRNILGVIKCDDWLNLFNINNIIYLCAMSYDDLDLDSDPKYEWLRDAIIEKILMLTVAFYLIGNEMKIWNSANDTGIYYTSKALEIASRFLAGSCPIVKHYIKEYNGGLEGNIGVKDSYDVKKDDILYIGDEEIKIIENHNTNNGNHEEGENKLSFSNNSSRGINVRYGNENENSEHQGDKRRNINSVNNYCINMNVNANNWTSKIHYNYNNNNNNNNSSSNNKNQNNPGWFSFKKMLK